MGGRDRKKSHEIKLTGTKGKAKFVRSWAKQGTENENVAGRQLEGIARLSMPKNVSFPRMGPFSKENDVKWSGQSAPIFADDRWFRFALIGGC